MTTHINGIVQTTRRMLAMENDMRETTGAERATAQADWQTESDRRGAQVLAAIKDGVEPDLMTWAIGMQTPKNRAVTDLLAAAYRLAAIAESE